MNFLYTIDPEAEEPIMLIDKHIGYDEEDGEGIRADQFTRELLSLSSKKRVEVWISSPGGNVVEGQQITSAILSTPSKVDTYCVGIAASIALPIFLAGRKRKMADYALLMTHNVSGTDNYEVAKKFKDSIITMISSRSNKTPEELNFMMNRTTWINSKEAHDFGMCDEVVYSSEANKKHLRTDNLQAAWKDAALIYNKHLPTKTTKSNMLKITNKLGLNDQANEDSILSAIDKIENRAKESETLCNSLKEELQSAKNQLKEKETAIKALEDEKATAEKEAKEKEAERLTNEANEVIEGFVKVGKIKNEAEVIKTWKEKYITDPKGIKNLLDAQPVSKVGVNLVNKSEPCEGAAIAWTASALMADINNKTKNNA